MKDQTPSQKACLVLLLLSVGTSFGIVASRMDAGHLRNAVLSLNWFLWLLFTVMYPVSVVESGALPGTQTGHLTHRRFSPVPFWTGLVATTVLWITWFLCITLMSYMAWHRGA
ncbi:hypothetical protein ACFOLC_15745 [Lysobacter cavernae]|uniref:DUF1467 family protein n=1 Tax=Lysobacter cavernae TaxID=1685901 RepID=A0ABV7RUX8_9GAMM